MRSDCAISVDRSLKKITIIRILLNFVISIASVRIWIYFETLETFVFDETRVENLLGSRRTDDPTKQRQARNTSNILYPTTIPVVPCRLILDRRPLTNQLVASLSLNSTSALLYAPPFTSGGPHYPPPWGPHSPLLSATIPIPWMPVPWRGPSFHSSPVRWWPRWPRPGPGMNITSVVPLRNTPPPVFPLSSSPRAVRHVLVPPWPATLLPLLFLPPFLFFLSSLLLFFSSFLGHDPSVATKTFP